MLPQWRLHMSTAPVITIFVRHSEDCKYKGDEFTKRCQCKKHLRWTHNGTQYRKAAGTRSWAEAETVKREIEDQLAGRTSPSTPADTAKSIGEAVALFIADKKVQGLTPDLIKKYTLWLGRLQAYCESKSVYTVQGITREIVTGFCADWPERYPSTYTRAKLRERYKSFLRYCFEAQWLDRVPVWPKFKIEEPPTMPLMAEEYARLLDAVYVAVRDRNYDYWVTRVRALFQLMRWSGLAIMDALTLRRDELIHDEAKGIYRVTTQRTKTGTDVSVPLPPDVARELLAVPNTNPVYFFWSGVGSKKSITGNWGKRFIVPSFKAAKIENGGHMMSHRLRDTFAVELLQKGIPMEEVSKLLGHTSIRTTEKHYAKWVKSRQDRLDALVVETWAAPAKKRKAARGSHHDAVRNGATPPGQLTGASTGR
jgi:integrase/recombinase XerD